MWRMLQQSTPDDFVVATGQTWEVRELVRLAFEHVDLDYHKFVELDPAFLRPAEVDLLVGDPSKAERVMGWKPTLTFQQLVKRMVDADLERVRKEG